MAKKKAKTTRRVAKKKPAKVKPPKGVSFDYVKSMHHRVIWASGAHGGPSPNGRYLHMSVFNERLPIPRRETFGLDSAGKMTGKVVREQRDAIIREVETTILMDVVTAQAVQKWLKDNIKTMQNIEKARASAVRKSDTKK